MAVSSAGGASKPLGRIAAVEAPGGGAASGASLAGASPAFPVPRRHGTETARNRSDREDRSGSGDRGAADVRGHSGQS